MPRGGDKERGQMPGPRDRRLPTLLQFFFFFIIIIIIINRLCTALKPTSKPLDNEKVRRLYENWL